MGETQQGGNNLAVQVNLYTFIHHGPFFVYFSLDQSFLMSSLSAYCLQVYPMISSSLLLSALGPTQDYQFLLNIAKSILNPNIRDVNSQV